LNEKIQVLFKSFLLTYKKVSAPQTIFLMNKNTSS